MNALLIHNDNLLTETIDAFPNQLAFNIPIQAMINEDFSFDRFADEQLSKYFKDRHFDVIFIPFSLSTENYLEFSGVRLALHIRLTPEFGHSFCPFVFIGFESKDQVAKLTPLGNFLFTTGVFATNKQDYKSLQEQFDWIIKYKPNLNDSEFQSFLDKVKIDPPSNYSSHHSLDNELALVRWSEYIGCDNQIPEVKNNLQTGLFFKYQKALYPIESVVSGKPFLITGKAKVLLIDDEAVKGWYIFYKNFFKYCPSISLDYLSIDFKSLTGLEIINEAKKKVSDFDPDIVLLDLRLCDSDFDDSIKPKELSGIKILEEIKLINKGIQVIITTASNKAWNYEAGEKYGANGYIIKQGSSNVIEDLKNLKSVIEFKILQAPFLKEIHKRFQNIKTLIFHLNSEIDDFKSDGEGNLEVAYTLIEKSFYTPRFINYSYLQLFLILEQFVKQPNVFEEGELCYVVINESRYLVLKLVKGEAKGKKRFESAISMENNSGHYTIHRGFYENRFVDTNFKISALLLFKNGCTTSGEKNWTSIYTTRNRKAAHPGSGLINKDEFLLLVDFLEFVFDGKNIKLQDISLALKEPTFDELTSKLKDKYNKR